VQRANDGDGSDWWVENEVESSYSDSGIGFGIGL
jgi:hypothetical protein